jgi:cytochrome c
MQDEIKIQRLKSFVSQNLPAGHALRETILNLDDSIDTASFLLWIPIWDKLIEIKKS